MLRRLKNRNILSKYVGKALCRWFTVEFKITPKPPSKIGKGVLYCTPYRTLADLHPACGIELALKNAD